LFTLAAQFYCRLLMSGMANCYCYGKLLSDGEEYKRRHNLGNKQLQNIVQALTSLVSAVNSEIDVSKFKEGLAWIS